MSAVRPITVEPRNGYKIWLRYSDGVEGEVDLSHLTGKGVFRAWDDRAFFESVKLDEYGDIAWGDDIDMCQDALYMELTGKTLDEILPVLYAPTPIFFDGDMVCGLEPSVRSNNHNA